MVTTLTKQQTVEQIVKEVSKLTKADQALLLKEIRIRRLMAEDRPIVKSRDQEPLSLEEINEIKHLSRRKHA